MGVDGEVRFVRPKATTTTTEACGSPNLYVANCGPAVGLSLPHIASVFGQFGAVTGVHDADDTGTRVVVCFSHQRSAEAALNSLHGRHCALLNGRRLHIQYSIAASPAPPPAADSVSVCTDASQLGIRGLYVLHDFVTDAQERDLLAAVDARPWKGLAKRRVQHYGYEFLYEIRNIDVKQVLGELPSFTSCIVEKLSSFPNLGIARNNIVDQLTVNEYPPGVGLSPHIDTHSAFDGYIFSLSLAGSCIIEFRKYPQGSWLPLPTIGNSEETEISNSCSNILRRAVFLPPRSMLLLSKEARYAWHHYIPHHKVDMVGGHAIRRGSRRVSFTFRKVRTTPCCCDFPQYCDSQMG